MNRPLHLDEATKRRLDPDRRWGWLDAKRGVYFARFGTYVKIGYSSMMGRRLREIETHLPENLDLLGAMIDGTPKDERRFHRQFDEYRLCREWFALAPDIVIFAKRRGWLK